MKHIELAYKNGKIIALFENEVEKKLSLEFLSKGNIYSILSDTNLAIECIKRAKEIKTKLKAEIEFVLGFPVDVGFDPDAIPNGIYDDVNELSEALNMILEGVTE